MSDQIDEQMIPTPSDFGHFLLERELGHGGMGGVYLARDKMLDRQVGIKVMLKSLGDDPAFVERFQREAQAAARLNHPNIAQIYSFGKENGMPYIAMELVSGGSLDKEMEQNPGTLDPVHVMRVGQQLADALALAADQGLVHGDVKPENVLYDTDGNAKLVDFGLAAMQGDSNEIWGTPYYISPEKVRRQKIDFRADIYSLGGTLYHALTGVAPFEGEDATEVVKARFMGPPRKPSEVRADIPPEIDTIIMRMLEVEPSMRYPTYQSLLGDFKRYLSKAGPAKKPGKTSGPKVKIRGTKMKMKLTPEETGASPDGVADLEPLDGEPVEEKKHMNLGVVVAATLGAIVLVILLIVGGIFWWLHAKEQKKQEEETRRLNATHEKAGLVIKDSRKKIEDWSADFHAKVEKCDRDFAEAVRSIKGALPPNMRDAALPMLEIAPPQDIADAVAATNQMMQAYLAQAAAPRTVAPETATNAAETATAPTNTAVAATNGTAKADAAVAAATNGTAQAAAAAKKPAAPAEETKEEKKEAAEEKEDAAEADSGVRLPVAVRQFSELWADVYACRAADIRVQGQAQVLMRMAAEMDRLSEPNADTVKQLGELSKQLAEGYEKLVNMKSVEQARRKLGSIPQKSKSLVRDCRSQVKVMLDRAERAAKEKAEEEAKKAQAEKEAAEHKTRVAEETKAAQDTFVRLVDTRLKYLEWDRALDELRKLLEKETTTIEGREEVRSQIGKVECMQALHKLFIDKAKDFKFRDETVVTAVDEKGLTLAPVKYVKGKKVPGREQTVEWRRFYGKKEYVGYMNQLINSLVMRGRDSLRTAPLPWSRQMLGAALTLQLLYTEVEGAAQFAPVLVKKAAAEFEDCQKWTKKWFPDVNVEAE